MKNEQMATFIASWEEEGLVGGGGGGGGGEGEPRIMLWYSRNLDPQKRESHMFTSLVQLRHDSLG